MTKEIKLPDIKITLAEAGWLLFMMTVCFLIAPEAWGVYCAVLPAMSLMRWLTDCNVVWSVSKKYTIIKFLFTFIFAMSVMVIGTYLS